MRCRGLTGSQRVTDLPIPRLTRTLQDRHLVNSPYAIAGPPASRRPSRLPPRWPAVQVMNDFLLRALRGTQGVSGNPFKILLLSTVRGLLSPAIAAYPPDTHSFCTAARAPRQRCRPQPPRAPRQRCGPTSQPGAAPARLRAQSFPSCGGCLQRRFAAGRFVQATWTKVKVVGYRGLVTCLVATLRARPGLGPRW
jgi:hypothetical protein